MRTEVAPPELIDYQLITRLNLSLTEIDNADNNRLLRLLKIDGLVQELKRRQQQKQNNQRKHGRR